MVDKSLDLPSRRYLAHPPPIERFNKPIILFCTVCLKDRIALLDSIAAVKAIQEAWADAIQWRVGEFLCMPDHVHFFCVPGVIHPENVTSWCHYWKRLMSQRLPALTGRWQMDVWDTQIRDSAHYVEKLSYVRQNPVRKELVSEWEQWPYRGVLSLIRW